MFLWSRNQIRNLVPPVFSLGAHCDPVLDIARNQRRDHCARPQIFRLHNVSCAYQANAHWTDHFYETSNKATTAITTLSTGFTAEPPTAIPCIAVAVGPVTVGLVVVAVKLAELVIRGPTDVEVMVSAPLLTSPTLAQGVLRSPFVARVLE